MCGLSNGDLTHPSDRGSGGRQAAVPSVALDGDMKGTSKRFG